MKMGNLEDMSGLQMGSCSKKEFALTKVIKSILLLNKALTKRKLTAPLNTKK